MRKSLSEYLYPYIEDLIEEKGMAMTPEQGTEILDNYLELMSKAIHDVRIPKVVFPWGWITLDETKVRKKLESDYPSFKMNKGPMSLLVLELLDRYLGPIYNRYKLKSDKVCWHTEKKFQKCLKDFKLYRHALLLKGRHGDEGVELLKTYIKEVDGKK